MKVRMKGDISGTRDGQRWPKRGEVATVSDAEGALLCAQGMAEPVAETAAAKAEKRPAKRAEKRG